MSASSSRSESQLAKASDPLASFFSDPFFNNFSLAPFRDMPSFGELARLPERAGMKLDIKESDTEFQIHADVPGYAKDQVKVELDADNVLHISTDRKNEKKEEGERDGWKFHRMERSSSSQHRAVKLPVNVDASKISAACDNGVLNVSIPKVAGTPADRRRITIA